MAQLKKSEKRLVVLAGSIVFTFVLNQYVCGKSEEHQVETTKKVEAKSRIPEQTSPEVKKNQRSRVKKTVNQMQFTSWGRDPFWEAFRLAEIDTANADSSNFVLRGVIWKGGEAYVLIGDAVLKEGERSGDLKILDIEKNRVVCKKGRKIITLVLQNDEHL